MKKKWMCTLLALGMLIFSACGEDGAQAYSDGQERARHEADGSGLQDGSSGSYPETAQADDSEMQDKSGGNNPGKNRTDSPGGALSLLYHLQRGQTACCTGEGYYYLSGDWETLQDGQAARHLMYMDFASRQEIYLCSDAACTHNTEDCTSVFPVHEFRMDTALFAWNGGLYILSKDMDHEGTAIMGTFDGTSGVVIEAAPTVLYRADPDGTNREKVYSFDPAVTVEDFVVGDERGLYLIIKKVTTEQSGGVSYQTASERELVYLDLSTGRETDLFSMDFGDHISWDIIGCTGRKLVLHGIDFGRELSEEEKLSDDKSIYDNSYDVFATLDVDSGSLIEIYRVFSPDSRSYETDGNNLYYSVSGEGNIISVDLRTAEQKTLCTIPQDSIWGIVGGRLYTRDADDKTYYFIDVNTGEISHCGLVDKSLGYSLDIIAEAGDQVLVIYDTDATPKGDGSYTVGGYRYGLISKEDLFAGRDNFAPIHMIGSGM